MNITILTIGSRGDVQPFVALGVGLKEAGHEVTLATGKAFEAFVTEHGLRHVALDVDLLERLQSVARGQSCRLWQEPPHHYEGCRFHVQQSPRSRVGRISRG